MNMEPLVVESLFPDGETVRKVRITLISLCLLRVEVLEGPPLGDLSEYVRADAHFPNVGTAWEDYIATKWNWLPRPEKKG
jgi:hypothetical protein